MDYVGDAREDHTYANKLIENTGNNLPFKGILLEGVEKELDGIIGNNSIEAIRCINRIIFSVKKSDSKEVLRKAINRYPRRQKPSEDMVFDEFLFRLNQTPNFKIAFELSSKITFDFKKRKEILKGKLKKCNYIDLGNTKQKYSNEFSKIKNILSFLFPIKKEKDKIDNEHIMNAVAYSKNFNTAGWFITNDNLRKSIKDSDASASTFNHKVMEVLQIKFNIKKLKEFLVYFKVF